MFITETDLINMKITADAAINNSEIIKSLIQEDVSSPQKQFMAVGERYYVGEHDILNQDFTSVWLSETSVDAAGKEIEEKKWFQNPNRSNHHNVNAFHRILVEQKSAYLVGREPTITVKSAENNQENKAYESLLATWADDNFNDALQDWIIGASNKGWEALHVYYDKNGDLQYCIVPASELILIYDTEHETQLQQVIRYYDTMVIKGKDKKIRKRVEWWTAQDVTYYMEDDNHAYFLDRSYAPNPAAHWYDISLLNGAPQKMEPHSWGRVPFVILKNNNKSTSDLQPIKGLIDAYDLISSEGTNNLLDLVDLYWVIEGYGGETAKSIARKLQINKAVHISDSNGKVEAKQVELPVTSRLEYLKMLRRDIYNFGQGVDVDSDKFGNAPSGVSLKFHYTLLDLKANAMAAKLRKAVKEFFWFLTDDHNRHNGTSYDSNLIEVSLNMSQIANDMETVQMIVQSKGIVSDKTLLSKHPFVVDVNEELKDIENQEQKEQEQWEQYQTSKKGGVVDAQEEQ